MSQAPVIPRPAATLIPVRDGAHGIEVFMLRRSDGAGFAAGAFVFPGGVVDAQDGEAEAAALCTGLDDIAASRELGVAEGGLAYWVGAIRECFEEAGLLFAREAAAASHDELLEITTPQATAEFIELRRSLNAGEDFAALCRARGLRFASDRLQYLSHWITPKGLPRRYDTRFFVGIAPDAQTPLHDGRETVEHIWITPAEALARHGRGEFSMLFATANTLETLSRFADCQSLLADVRTRNKGGVHVPRRASGRAGPRVVGREDFAYAEIGKLDPEGRGNASYEIVPGVVTTLSRKVRRLTAPNPGFMTGPGTNSYLLGDGKDLAVIDPGPPIDTHVRALIDAAEAIGGTIRWILTTHTHLDHSPAALMLQAETSAQLIGMPPPPHERQDQSFKPSRVPEDGERIEVAGCVLRAIHTPGHASNHLCYLLQDEKILFTGDHVMQGSTVVINPPDGNMQAYLDSLGGLLESDAAYLAPGHGFLIEQPAKEIDRLLRHRLKREAKVVEALRQTGAATLESLVSVAYDDVEARVHPVASRSLLAHLIKLEADGRVSRALADGSANAELWRLN